MSNTSDSDSDVQKTEDVCTSTKKMKSAEYKQKYKREWENEWKWIQPSTKGPVYAW